MPPIMAPGPSIGFPYSAKHPRGMCPAARDFLGRDPISPLALTR